MQQHPLIGAAQAEERANLIGGQAVDVTEGHHSALPFGQFSQAILKLAASFGSHDLVFW
jgi:hypothetical protein